MTGRDRWLSPWQGLLLGAVAGLPVWLLVICPLLELTGVLR